MKSLANKTILITGAAGGIGTALSKQLVLLGCNLLLVDIQSEQLNTLKTELLKTNPKATVETYTVDLCKADEIEQLIQSIQQIDVLINNAGIVFGESFSTMQQSKINKIIAINLTASMQLTHGLLPLLSKSKVAHIVNVSSGAGLLAPGGMVAYGASKHGLVGFSEALRAELKNQNIGVSVICPAFVKTNIIQNSESDKDLDDNRLKKLDTMVQQQGVTPEKVAFLIIKSIQRNKGRIVIGSLTKSALILRFFFPKLAEKLNANNYQKMIKQGLIE